MTEATAPRLTVGNKVRIIRHSVGRYSPYKGKIGTVEFVPPPGENWPYIVAVPDFATATMGKNARGRRFPWPTTFAREELEAVM